MQLNPPVVNARPRNFPNISKARMLIATKAIIAKGKRYSTTLHNRGTNTIPSIKQTLTLIARARGMAISWVSALEDLILI
ncbi:MAG: hypothetical protein A4E59_00925 [Syntrophorhabdus sp. PtaB.Bin027]|nr:MAG: hypothetical protein A4E59_00925 [Syntrophorhabdus sp. PtaB.Bin027]